MMYGGTTRSCSLIIFIHTFIVGGYYAFWKPFKRAFDTMNGDIATPEQNAYKGTILQSWLKVANL